MHEYRRHYLFLRNNKCGFVYSYFVPMYYYDQNSEIILALRLVYLGLGLYVDTKQQQLIHPPQSPFTFINTSHNSNPNLHLSLNNFVIFTDFEVSFKSPPNPQEMHN